MIWQSKPPIGTPLNINNSLFNGLMLWYPLLEGGGTVVRNPFNQALHSGVLNGMIVNSATTGWTGGNVGGRALLFDGSDDYIAAGTSLTAFDFANKTFTVSGRFKTTSTSNIYIFGKMGFTSNTGGWGVGVTTGGTTGRFGVVTKNTGASSNCVIRESSSSVNDGRWHSFSAIIRTDSVTSGNNTATIYIDGTLDQGTTTLSGVSDGTASGDALTIGKRATGNFFTGSLDNLMIHNRALTSAEISILHRSPWSMFRYPTTLKQYLNSLGGATTSLLARVGIFG